MKRLILLFFIAAGIMPVNSIALPASPGKYKEVYYLAWTGSYIGKETQYIMDSKVPLYLGAMCIDDTDHLSYFPKDPEFELNYKGRAVVKNINQTGRIKLEDPLILASKATSTARGPGFHSPSYPVVHRGDPAFAEFVERKLWEEGLLVFRRELNAAPDMEWTPEFLEQYDYRDYCNDPGKILELTGRFMESRGVDQNQKVLIKWK